MSELLFPTLVSPGAVGGPVFSTRVVSTAAGREVRAQEWPLARWEWEVAHDRRNAAVALAITAFFLAVKGRGESFRFLDPNDNSTNVPALTNGQVSLVPTKQATVALTSTTFQLVKRYSFGGEEYIRTIRKPIGDDLTDPEATQADSTVRIYNGGTEITSGWTVDLTTGIVTFDDAPGYTPSALFGFHAKARLDMDRLPMAQVDAHVFAVSRIPIIEVLD